MNLTKLTDKSNKMWILYVSLFICTCFADHSNNHSDVIIIGAGASGLQAAQTLVDNGIEDFLILEAADYIGGRVRDVEFGGIRLERGAHWAQPVGSNVQEKVWDIGMSTHQNNWFSLVVYNSTGHNITNEALPVFDQVLEKIVEAFDIADKLWELNDPDMPLRAGLRTVGWIPKTDIEHLLEWSHLDFENGEGPELVSLKAHAYIKDEFNKRVSEDQRSTLITDQRGYRYLFNATMPFLSDNNLSSNIQLNKKVATIDQSGDGVLVTTYEGETFHASRVLVTVSVSVLQNQAIEFIPKLPGWKLRTLNRFAMADYSKIYLQFPTNFWGDEEIILRTSSVRGRYPLFTNLDAEGLFPGSNILMADLTGEEARRVEALTEAEVQTEIVEVLRRVFGEANVPDPLDILVSGWSRNPLTMGAYSVWTANMEEECFGKMSSRVGDIFFAGEYTSDDNGYVQGGLASGEREGLKIAQCQSGGTCPQWEADQTCYCPENDYDTDAVNNIRAEPALILCSAITYIILKLVFVI